MDAIRFIPWLSRQGQNELGVSRERKSIKNNSKKWKREKADMKDSQAENAKD